MYCLSRIYTCPQNIYIVIANSIKKVRDTHPQLLVLFIPIGLWQSCYTNFSSWHSSFFNCISTTINWMCTTTSMSNIVAHVNNSFTFLSHCVTSNFSSVMIVFHRLFTFTALGDVDLRFSFIFVPKTNAEEGGNTWSMRLNIANIINPYMWQWNYFLLSSSRR